MADLSSCLKFSLFLSLNEWVNLRKYCSSFCLRLTPEAWGIRAGWLCWVWYFEWLFPLILEADARFLTILVDSWLRKKLTHRQSEWKAHRALRLLPRSSCLIIMPGVRVTIITSPGWYSCFTKYPFTPHPITYNFPQMSPGWRNWGIPERQRLCFHHWCLSSCLAGQNFQTECSGLHTSTLEVQSRLFSCLTLSL